MSVYDFYLYKKMYMVLFHGITDALAGLPAGHPAAAVLRQAQQRAEELYMAAGEE